LITDPPGRLRMPATGYHADPAALAAPGSGGAGRGRQAAVLAPVPPQMKVGQEDVLPMPGGESARLEYGRPGRRMAGCPEPTGAVLAGRIAATLAHHDPGWRLPRISLLARYYGVKPAQVSAAVDDLVARHLVRRLSDGQHVRTGRAEYGIPLGDMSAVRTRFDPIGGALRCASSTVATRPLREDVARALGASAGDPGRVLKLLCTIEDEPAALSTTYVALAHGALIQHVRPGSQPAMLPLMHQPAGPGQPVLQAIQIEMQQPQPAAASLLGLPAAEQAIEIIARHGEPGAATAAAMTVAILRPDLFRVALETDDPPIPGLAAHSAAAGWWDLAAGPPADADELRLTL
jgi:hypothetical protein